MANTVLTIEEDVTNVTVQKITNAIDLTIEEDITNVTISAAVPTATFSAGNVTFDDYGGISSNYVQGAMEEIIDTYSRDVTEPGSPDEGDLFYDTDDNLLKIYADVSGGTNWVTLLQAGDPADMQNLDGGAF